MGTVKPSCILCGPALVLGFSYEQCREGGLKTKRQVYAKKDLGGMNESTTSGWGMGGEDADARFGGMFERGCRDAAVRETSLTQHPSHGRLDRDCPSSCLHHPRSHLLLLLSSCTQVLSSPRVGGPPGMLHQHELPNPTMADRNTEQSHSHLSEPPSTQKKPPPEHANLY